MQRFDPRDIPSHWPTIQHAAFEFIGKGAAGHLGSAKKVTLDGDTLTVYFQPNAAMSLELFDKNGNTEKLASLIKKMTSADIKIKLAVDQPQSGDATPIKTEAQMREDILSDPVVKMVLAALNASVSKIDFNTTGNE